MAFIDPDQFDLLKQARDRARRLVADIRRQRDDLLANPPAHLDADSKAKGEAAMDNALASAQRMLSAVEDALTMANRDEDDGTSDAHFN